MVDNTANIANAQNTLQGTTLFGRAVSLVLGFADESGIPVDVDIAFNDQGKKIGQDFSSLDLDFHVEKALKATDPNTLNLHIYNLAEASRQALSGQRALTVRLEAGYVGAVSQLYFAEARSAWTTREGPDFVTHVESTDTIASPSGVHNAKKPQVGDLEGNIFRTLGPKVPLDQAFAAIARALGIKEGNLKAALANMQGQALPAVNGGALVGNAARRMTDLCRSAGLEWSIQDGNLQLLNIGAALSTTKAILISDATGMKDSPSVDSQGAVSVTTCLIPGLAPGVLVTIDALFVQGTYRVEKCRYVGSTRGQQWDCQFDAVRY